MRLEYAAVGWLHKCTDALCSIPVQARYLLVTRSSYVGSLVHCNLRATHGDQVMRSNVDQWWAAVDWLLNRF